MSRALLSIDKHRVTSSFPLTTSQPGDAPLRSQSRPLRSMFIHLSPETQHLRRTLLAKARWHCSVLYGSVVVMIHATRLATWPVRV